MNGINIYGPGAGISIGLRLRRTLVRFDFKWKK